VEVQAEVYPAKQDGTPTPNVEVQTSSVSVDGRSEMIVRLRVTNPGEAGDFNARVVEITAAHDPPDTPWDVRWNESVKERDWRILPASSALLFFAQSNQVRGSEGPDWTPGFEFMRPGGPKFVAMDRRNGLDALEQQPLVADVVIAPVHFPDHAIKVRVRLYLRAGGPDAEMQVLEH
jgi:hypothetical protein